MKKYKLIIPDMVPKELLNEANLFSDFDGKRYSVNSVSATDIFDGKEYSVPTEWLHEIEEEKVITAEEWMSGKVFTSYEDEQPYIDRMIKEAFEAGEANNELRHQETESFREIIELKFGTLGVNRKDYDVHDLQKIWNACKESHNLE
jgi:hypothetical protein